MEPYIFSYITSNNEINNPPKYATPGAAAFDIQANENYTLKPGERHATETGLRLFWDDESIELQLRPRSGMAFKHGITLSNSPGTIDSDYQGEIKVGLWNTSDKPYEIHVGDRIAQGKFAPVIFPNNRFEQGTKETGGWVKVDEFPKTTERKADGFGSTGK